MIVAGSADGPVLASDVPLSLWGGVDARTSEVIDRTHPLCGRRLTGHVVVLPAGRGSSSASAVLLELIHAGCAPAAIVLRGLDAVLAAGIVVAEELFGRSLPLLVAEPDLFARALGARHASVRPDGTLNLDTVSNID